MKSIMLSIQPKWCELILFDLHLKAVYKADKPSKNVEKAMTKFREMIQGE